MAFSLSISPPGVHHQRDAHQPLLRGRCGVQRQALPPRASTSPLSAPTCSTVSKTRGPGELMRLGRKHPPNSRIYPLTGIARCARGGAPMRGSSSSGRRYYRDPAHDQCRKYDQPMVRALEAEAALGRRLHALSDPPDWRHHACRLPGSSRYPYPYSASSVLSLRNTSAIVSSAS